MKPESLQVLAERASAVEGRPAARLDEVHARISRAKGRRQLGAIAAAVVAVVLVLSAATVVLSLRDADTPPATPAPRPTVTPTELEPEVPSVRRLTYAEGQTIHWGDRTIDVGSQVTGLAATDDGVVFVREGSDLPRACRREATTGGCAALWFTAGSAPVHVGTVFGTSIRGFRIELASAGSTVVWFEPDVDRRVGETYRERGQYVVYDTDERREVARFGTADSDLKGVYDDTVYWTPDDHARCLAYSTYYAECRRFRSVMRLDTATGTQTEVPWAVFVSDRGSRPRTFVLPIRGEANTPGPVYDEVIGFVREGDRLVAGDENGDAMTARVGRTGEPVRLHLPAGYHDDVQLFFYLTWLDDDRFAISADNRGDILTCRLSSGRCRLAIKGPTPADERMTGFGGRG